MYLFISSFIRPSFLLSFIGHIIRPGPAEPLSGISVFRSRVQEVRRQNFRFAPSLPSKLGPLPFTWPRAAMVFPLVPPSRYVLFTIDGAKSFSCHPHMSPLLRTEQDYLLSHPHFRPHLRTRPLRHARLDRTSLRLSHIHWRR